MPAQGNRQDHHVRRGDGLPVSSALSAIGSAGYPVDFRGCRARPLGIARAEDDALPARTLRSVSPVPIGPVPPTMAIERVISTPSYARLAPRVPPREIVAAYRGYCVPAECGPVREVSNMRVLGLEAGRFRAIHPIHRPEPPGLGTFWHLGWMQPKGEGPLRELNHGGGVGFGSGHLESIEWPRR